MGFSLPESMSVNRNKVGLSLRQPVATYRVQLNREFDFNKLKDTLPYFSKLGISHIYASPIFEARQGSLHGYDITDPNEINTELGGTDSFNDLIKEMNVLGLAWIQDIVPNHIAYFPQSTIISDVMKFGSNSTYRNFLDVDWNYPSKKLRGKILAPFLMESYKKCLWQGQIRLAYRNGFLIRYGELEFPVKISSYSKILSGSNRFLSLPTMNKGTLFSKFRNQHSSDEDFGSEIEQILKKYNQDINLLDSLLSEQVYQLTNWRTAFKQINYRRFFDVSNLICLRMEETDAFETTHKLILQLLKEQKIGGLRVDHIDGLYDPQKYLDKLREAAQQQYIVVEKILQNNENLPESWLIQGTTGYDFLNYLNGLFVSEQNKTKMTALYQEFTGTKKTFSLVMNECKKSVICRYFAGDLANLARIMHQTLKTRSYGTKSTLNKIREAVIELLSVFAVYRTYINEDNSDEKTFARFKDAIEAAKERNGEIKVELDAIERLLKESTSSIDALSAIMRFQQFTGSIMAKGFEDTAFYVYNRLLSLNEVGGDPEKFGLSTNDFHMFLDSRQKKWPLSLNATATHDTKRGEDARARINVLSEVPSLFQSQIKKLSKIIKKKTIKDKLAPNRNEEYYFHQSLIGSFPFELNEIPEFTNRLKIHMKKALREAKINSNWISPNLQYEEAMTSFVDQIFELNKKNTFMQEFLPFHKKISFCGFLNSLSQTLIKITSPGVPDFYQGTELWDLNFVDPDNRRQVDFGKRQRYLDEIKKLTLLEAQRLLSTFEDGRIKIFEINKALEIRNKKRSLFQNGTYMPLKVKGDLRNHLIAFCRKEQTSCVIVIAPRFLAKLTDMQRLPLGEAWKNTFVCLPIGAKKVWYDAFSEKSLVSREINGDEGFWVDQLLKIFPVALLLSGESGNEVS